MLIRFTGSKSVSAMTVGQWRFTDGDEADLPEKEARQIVKQWPNQFKLVRPDKDKMMETSKDK